MAWSLLQSGATGHASSTGGYTYTLPGGAPAAGQLEVLYVASGTTVTSVSAGGGAAWTLLQSYVDFCGNYLYYRVANGSEGSSVSIVYNTPNGTQSTAHFQRWSGQAVSSPLDTSGISGNFHAGGSSTPSLSSGALAGAGELVVAFGTCDNTTVNSAPSAPVWSSGFTDDAAGSGWFYNAPAGIAAYAASNTSAGAGAVTAQLSVTWTPASDAELVTALAAFKPSAGIGIITATLPVATPSASYSTTLAAGGGTAPYTWAVTSGALPAWASLGSSTGVISGTAPGAAQVTSFTVTVTDSVAATASQAFVLPVGPYPAGSPGGGPWILTFSDDFTAPWPTPYGTGPDPAVWADRLVYGEMFRTQNGSGTGTETSWAAHGYYGHSVAGSALTLTARYENIHAVDPVIPSGNLLPNTNTGLYTTGVASSFPGFAFSFGYVEARIQNNYPSVFGSWPAFWMLCYTQWPPEIDIDEYNLTGNSGNFVHEGYYQASSFSWVVSNNFTTDGAYHAYGLQLDGTNVTFYFDGAQVIQHGYGDAGSAWPWHVQLVHQCTYDSTGTGFPTAFNVDYVRYWNVQGAPARPVIAGLSPGGTPSAGSVAVSFGPVPGATSYRVTAFPQDQLAYVGMGQYPTSNVTSALITGTGSASPVTVSGLTNGKPYCFTVAAINATGYSVESLPVPPPVTGRPRGLLAASFP